MDRRRFLRITAAGLGGLLLAEAGATRESDAEDLIVVSNAGGSGGSVTLIDPRRLEVVTTLDIDGTFSFPANRWHFGRDVIWSGLPAGPNAAVFARSLASGETLVELPTGSSENYSELTPDGRHLIVAARYEDTYLKVSADRDAADFGRVVATLDAGPGAEPCDVTVTPDGAYAFAPERGRDTLGVLRLDTFERVVEVEVEPHRGPRLEPYMATVSPTGDRLFVENAPVTGGDERGSESVFDVTDPERPTEVARLTQDDGLGRGPITSEFTWDGRHAIVICRASSELSAIDTETLTVVASIPLPEGSNPLTGTSAGDGDTFFVPLPGRDAVAAVAVPSFELLELLPVGPRPMGVVYLRTQVPDRRAADVPLGRSLAGGRAFPPDCPDPCCGPI